MYPVQSHSAAVLVLLLQRLTSSLPLQPAPTGGNAGTCNANMLNNSVYTRFLYVIKVSPLAATLACSGLVQHKAVHMCDLAQHLTD